MKVSSVKEKKAIFILFGATGDLAIKKIFPALDALCKADGSGRFSRIIAASRREWDDADFQAHLTASSKDLSADFIRKIEYSKVDVDHGTGFEELAKIIETNVKEGVEPIVYLSLAPRYHALVSQALFDSKILTKGKGKLLIEKPFGTDEKTAKELDKLVLKNIKDSQVYRVDHYLGKDTIRAIMDLHENTGDFDKLISKESVESIHVRLFETKGIDGRGASYEGVGAFRDVGQNHMLEMLAVVAAELGKGKDKEKMWQNARAGVFKHLAQPAKTCDESRRAQYEGYLKEKGVEANSQTETAFEIRTSLASGKLKNIPLVLESGKKMPSSQAFIKVFFKEVSGIPKSITFSVQPKQEINIESRDGTIDTFEIPFTADAYANIIGCALEGNERGFVGSDEIEALWAYADRVVGCWNKVPLEIYSEKKPFLIP
jgi:glucose-6-phosphate 1-dehydrogenase